MICCILVTSILLRIFMSIRFIRETGLRHPATEVSSQSSNTFLVYVFQSFLVWTLLFLGRWYLSVPINNMQQVLHPAYSW